MTVLLCGVGADTGNVEPVPTVDSAGRFEYVPIPEKGPTTEEATYGTIDRRYGDGTLVGLIDRVRPNSAGGWIDDAGAIHDQPVHFDPNLVALTYGEHRPGYVAGLKALDPGDVVAFYTGLRSLATDAKHRYLIGTFTLSEPPLVLEPERTRREIAALLADHPANAHVKRFAGNGALYYHDPAFEGRTKPVAIATGREPGGLFDRAVRLSDRREGPGYYMAPDVAALLNPQQGGGPGTYLGGIKPAIRCDVDAGTFRAFVADRGASGTESS